MTPGRLILAAAILLAAPAAAEERADRLAAAFFDWAAEMGAPGPEIAVTRDGAPVLSQAVGREAGQPRLLASLSKSITAQCVAGLVEARRLRWDETLGQVLGWTGQAGEITVSGLVTQSAGLSDDRTQQAMPLWFDGAGDWRNVAGWGEVPGNPTYAYDNENYALLGSVIERVTGQDATAACDGVLPGATLAPEVAAFGPMGGWQARLTDYATFQALLWGNRPPDGPVAEVGGGAVYGLGMYGRPMGESWVWWHLGLLCMPGRVEAASFALVMRDGWSVAMAVDSCPGFEAMGTLDRALWEAFGAD